MARILTPKSKFAKDYDPKRRIQKIPVGESFTVEVTDAIGLAVNVADTGLANVAQILSAIGPPTSLFFQINVIAVGATKLVVKNPASSIGMDSLNLQIVAKIPRTENLIYSGSRLTWFRDDSPAVSFRATSGMGSPFQHAAQQRGLLGPIPEGRYSFLAKRDPQN